MIFDFFFFNLMDGAAVIRQGQDLDINMANETYGYTYHEKTKLKLMSFLYESCIFTSDSSAQQLVSNAINHSQGL